VVDARRLSSEYSPETFDASFAINLFVTPSLQKDGVEYLLMPADRGGYHVFRDDTRSRVVTVRSDRDLIRVGFSTDEVERFDATFQEWFRTEGDAVRNSVAADERIAAIFAGVRSVLRPGAAFFCNAEIELPIERIGALGFQIRHTFERGRDGRLTRYWVFAIDPGA